MTTFDKIKKQQKLYAAVKIGLTAAAAAVTVVIAVLLPCLLCGVDLLWAWYLLIGLGAFAVGGGVAFFIFRTDDEALSKKLDSDLALQERVQTAHAFREKDGAMLELQRADAEAHLSAASLKSLQKRNIAVIAALAAVLSLGIICLPITAVYAAAPTEAPPTVPVDPPRDITDWEWQALDELIEYVSASTKADETARSGMLAALNNLRSVLLGGVSESGLKVFVQNAVTEIRNAVSTANDSAGATEEQRKSNSEEEAYVVSELYKIFKMQQSGGGGDGEGENPSGDQDAPVSPGNNTGTGELIVNGVPFFDPELGYVSSGDPETREKYYAVIRQAMLEGTISRAEWELIVAQYFSDLNTSNQNQTETNE